MIIKDVLKLANSMPGNYTEKDVLDFFQTANIGHWPSEKGNLNISMEDGTIVFNVSNKGVKSVNHYTTPAGRIWLLGHFFENFQTQSWVDVNTVIDDKSFKGTLAKSSEFKEKVTERLTGKSRFMKDNDSRLAFVERIRNNSDGSILYSYDVANLDRDGSYKFILMVPGKKTFIYIYEQSDSGVSLAVESVIKKDLEDMTAGERAYFFANIQTKNFVSKNIKKQTLEAAFLLTADSHEQEIIKKLVGED